MHTVHHDAAAILASRLAACRVAFFSHYKGLNSVDQRWQEHAAAVIRAVELLRNAVESNAAGGAVGAAFPDAAVKRAAERVEAAVSALENVLDELGVRRGARTIPDASLVDVDVDVDLDGVMQVRRSASGDDVGLEEIVGRERRLMEAQKRAQDIERAIKRECGS